MQLTWTSPFSHIQFILLFSGLWNLRLRYFDAFTTYMRYNALLSVLFWLMHKWIMKNCARSGCSVQPRARCRKFDHKCTQSQFLNAHFANKVLCEAPIWHISEVLLNYLQCRTNSYVLVQKMSIWPAENKQLAAMFHYTNSLTWTEKVNFFLKKICIGPKKLLIWSEVFISW